MAIVDHLVNNFVNQHKVFTDCFFIQDTTVVSKDLHHAVYQVNDCSRLDIVLTSCNKENSELLGKEVVNSINIKSWWRVSWPELYLAKEYFARLPS